MGKVKYIIIGLTIIISVSLVTYIGLNLLSKNDNKELTETITEYADVSRQLEIKDLTQETNIEYSTETASSLTLMTDEELSEYYYKNALLDKLKYANINTNTGTQDEDTSNLSDAYLEKINTLLQVAESLIGTPYVWGGTTAYKGMDCSGYSQYVMRQLGYSIPRVSKDQANYGELISRNSLRPGDLLFFDTTNPRDASDIKTPTQEMQYAEMIEDGYIPTTVSHVGIYIGNGVMLHASSGDGYITYADLNSNYYKNRFLFARRVVH